MPHILVIDDDAPTLETFSTVLRTAGHDVLTASCGADGLALLRQRNIDVVLSDLTLPDMSGLEVLGRAREWRATTPFVLTTGAGTMTDAVAAMRLGASDFVNKPIACNDLVRTVARALGQPPHGSEPDRPCEAHAVSRWARALIPVIDSPTDPRSITAWGRWVAASPGALRNWCRTAGVTPRHSLVFGRLLRAVLLAEGGRHRLENLLDVVDRRTLANLLKLAGFGKELSLPPDISEFLRRQVLVQDRAALREIERVLDERLMARIARTERHA